MLSQHESEILNGRDQRLSFSSDSALRSALRVANVVCTKCEHYSYKVVVVLAKLTLFVQSMNIIRTKSSLSLQSWRCLYKVVVVLCTKFCTKKEESWKVNIDIKTASYSWASVFASSEKSCFVRDLVFFISLAVYEFFMFLNATRRDRNCPAFASKGKKWIHAIH